MATSGIPSVKDSQNRDLILNEQSETNNPHNIESTQFPTHRIRNLDQEEETLLQTSALPSMSQSKGLLMPVSSFQQQNMRITADSQGQNESVYKLGPNYDTKMTDGNTGGASGLLKGADQTQLINLNQSNRLLVLNQNSTKGLLQVDNSNQELLSAAAQGPQTSVLPIQMAGQIKVSQRGKPLQADSNLINQNSFANNAAQNQHHHLQEPISQIIRVSPPRKVRVEDLISQQQRSGNTLLVDSRRGYGQSSTNFESATGLKSFADHQANSGLNPTYDHQNSQAQQTNFGTLKNAESNTFQPSTQKNLHHSVPRVRHVQQQQQQPMEIAKHDIGINASFAQVVNGYGRQHLEDVLRGVAISSKQQGSTIEENSSISGFLTPNRVAEPGHHPSKHLQTVKTRDPLKMQMVNLDLASPVNQQEDEEESSEAKEAQKQILKENEQKKLDKSRKRIRQRSVVEPWQKSLLQEKLLSMPHIQIFKSQKKLSQATSFVRDDQKIKMGQFMSNLYKNHQEGQKQDQEVQQLKDYNIPKEKLDQIRRLIQQEVLQNRLRDDEQTSQQADGLGGPHTATHQLLPNLRLNTHSSYEQNSVENNGNPQTQHYDSTNMMRSNNSLHIQENVTEENEGTINEHQEQEDSYQNQGGAKQNNLVVSSRKFTQKLSNLSLASSVSRYSKQHQPAGTLPLSNDQSKSTGKDSRAGVMSFLRSNQSIEEASDQKPNIADSILFDESEQSRARYIFEKRLEAYLIAVEKGDVVLKNSSPLKVENLRRKIAQNSHHEGSTIQFKKQKFGGSVPPSRTDLNKFKDQDKEPQKHQSYGFLSPIKLSYANLRARKQSIGEMKSNEELFTIKPGIFRQKHGSMLVNQPPRLLNDQSNLDNLVEKKGANSKLEISVNKNSTFDAKINGAQSTRSPFHRKSSLVSALNKISGSGGLSTSRNMNRVNLPSIETLKNELGFKSPKGQNLVDMVNSYHKKRHVSVDRAFGAGNQNKSTLFASQISGEIEIEKADLQNETRSKMTDKMNDTQQSGYQMSQAQSDMDGYLSLILEQINQSGGAFSMEVAKSKVLFRQKMAKLLPKDRQKHEYMTYKGGKRPTIKPQKLDLSKLDSKKLFSLVSNAKAKDTKSSVGTSSPQRQSVLSISKRNSQDSPSTNFERKNSLKQGKFRLESQNTIRDGQQNLYRQDSQETLTSEQKKELLEKKQARLKQQRLERNQYESMTSRDKIQIAHGLKEQSELTYSFGKIPLEEDVTKIGTIAQEITLLRQKDTEKIQGAQQKEASLRERRLQRRLSMKSFMSAAERAQRLKMDQDFEFLVSQQQEKREKDAQEQRKKVKQLLKNYVFNCKYRKKIDKFKDAKEGEIDVMQKHFENMDNQEIAMKEVLKELNKADDANFEQLSNILNTKANIVPEESKEFSKLIDFLDDFLGIRERSKTKNYIGGLLENFNDDNSTEVSFSNQQNEKTFFSQFQEVNQKNKSWQKTAQFSQISGQTQPAFIKGKIPEISDMMTKKVPGVLNLQQQLSQTSYKVHNKKTEIKSEAQIRLEASEEVGFRFNENQVSESDVSLSDEDQITEAIPGYQFDCRHSKRPVVLVKALDDSNELGQEVQDSIQQKLLRKLEFGQLMKKDLSGVKNEKPENVDPQVKFASMISRGNLSLPKPILDSKVQHLKELRLQQVLISTQLAQVIALTLPTMKNLRKINFDETGLQDQSFGAILNSIDKNLPNFSTIEFKGKNNVFGKTSMLSMSVILKRKIPFQLKELVFDRSRIIQAVQDDLIRSISADSLLEKLSFNQVLLSKISFGLFCKNLNKIYTLRDLSLAELSMPATTFGELIPEIAANRTLRSLDLSQNNLIDPMADNEKYDDNGMQIEVQNTPKKKISEQVQLEKPLIHNILIQSARKNFPKKSKRKPKKPKRSFFSRIEEEDDQLNIIRKDRQTQNFVLKNLAEFMALNQYVQHINLAFCGINDLGVQQIAQFVKFVQLDPQNGGKLPVQRLRNLRAIHLSAFLPTLRELKSQYKHTLQDDKELFGGITTINQRQLVEKVQNILTHQTPFDSGFNSQSRPQDAKNQFLNLELEDLKGSDLKKHLNARDSIGMRSPIKNLGQNLKSVHENSEETHQGADPQKYNNIIVLQRLLNHSEQLSDVDQPQILANTWQVEYGKKNNACHICSKAQYTLIFAKIDQKILDQKRSKSQKKPEVHLQFIPSSKQIEKQPFGALINGFQIQMQSVEHFCSKLEFPYIGKEKLATMMREQGLTPIDYHDEAENHQKKEDNRIKIKEFKKQYYRQFWRQTLVRCSEYATIQTVGDIYPKKSMRDTDYALEDTETIMVCALMLNPGRHQYVVKVDGEVLDSTPQTFFSKQEKLVNELDQFQPNYKSFKQLKAKFVTQGGKTSSEGGKLGVFKNWEDEDGNILKQMIESDTKVWNLRKVVTAEYEHKNIVALLKRNAKELKDIYTGLVALGATYPHLDFKSFIDFCISAKIIEENGSVDNDQNKGRNVDMNSSSQIEKSPGLLKDKNAGDKVGGSIRGPQQAQFTRNQAILCFAYTILQPAELVQSSDIPLSIVDRKEREKAINDEQVRRIEASSKFKMNRYQFFEVLVRMALLKYHEPLIERSVPDSVRRFIETELLDTVQIRDPSKVRHQKFYRKPILDILEANQALLEKTFVSYQHKSSKGQFMKRKVVLSNILEKLFGFTNAQARIIYAQSKMTIKDEQALAEEYQRLRYDEFLELICRVAAFLNQSNPDCDTMTFAEQLKQVLSRILWSIKLHLVDPEVHWQCEALYDIQQESGESEESEGTSALLLKSKTLSLDSIVNRRGVGRVPQNKTSPKASNQGAADKEDSQGGESIMEESEDDLFSDDSLDKAAFGSVLDSDDDSDLSDNEKERRRVERERKENSNQIQRGQVTIKQQEVNDGDGGEYDDEDDY